jgi:hypothetical protein
MTAVASAGLAVGAAAVCRRDRLQHLTTIGSKSAVKFGGDYLPRWGSRGPTFTLPDTQSQYVFSAVRPVRKAPVGRGSVRAGSPASIAVHGGFEVLGFRAISSKTSQGRSHWFFTGSSIVTSCWRLLRWTASDAGARLGVESRSGAVEVGSALTVSDPFGCRCLSI